MLKEVVELGVLLLYVTAFAVVVVSVRDHFRGFLQQRRLSGCVHRRRYSDREASDSALYFQELAREIMQTATLFETDEATVRIANLLRERVRMPWSARNQSKSRRNPHPHA